MSSYTQHNVNNRISGYAIGFLSAFIFAAYVDRVKAAPTIIYADTFQGSSGSLLNGTAPLTQSGTLGGQTGATWDANAIFKADGSVIAANAFGSAVLPFTPLANEIYTLTATIDTTEGGSDWLAMGFEQFDNTSNNFTNPNNANAGYSWMLLRGTRGIAQGQFLYGPGNGGKVNFDDSDGTLKYTVVLDTSAPQWTAQFYLNDTALDAPHTYTTNPVIGYVGFSQLKTASGTVGSFSLSAVAAPEPGNVFLLVSGALLIMGRRHRQRC